MSDTVQEMYFRTEEEMEECEAWLPANMNATDYEVRERGVRPEHEYFYLSIWFIASALIIPFYDANAHLMFEGEDV